MATITLVKDRMVLKSRVRVPAELEPYQRDRVTYSFPLCGDIIRRLMAAIPNLSIDDDLMEAFGEISRKQKETLGIARMDDFDLPYTRLYPYQRVGVAWLNSVGRGILADEQGLGKTVTAVSAARLADPKKALIVCPNSKKDDWARHAEEWIPGADVTILEGEASHREEILRNWKSGYLVCNYTIACMHHKDMKTVNLVIVDEAHKMRNRKTDLFKAMRRITSKSKHVILVTASPTVNEAGDLWTLLYLCDPKRFSSYWGFVYRFCDISHNGFGVEVGGLLENERKNLERMLSPYILMREGMLELPDMKYRTVSFELEGVHRELYRSLEDEHLARYKGQEVKALTELSLITRLRQMVLHPGLLFDNYEGNGKLDTLREVIEERPGKVVVFTHYSKLVDMTVDYLEGHGIRSVGYTGSLNDESRREALHEFRQGDAQVIVMTHGVGGEGLDLVEADRVIMLELAWHPAGNAHAVRRILRHGQTSDTVETIVINTPGSIEDDIFAIIQDKKEVTIQEIMRRRQSNE